MPARVFLAIDPSAGSRRTLARLQGALRDQDPSWVSEKWVRPDLLHVTVRFIGAMSDAEVPLLIELLTASMVQEPCFDLTLDGVRAMPGARRAAMLWATLTGDVGRLDRLRAAVAQAVLDATDVHPVASAFRPHVTLARARRPHRFDDTAIEAARALLTGSVKDPDRIMSVRSLTLYASTLTATGPIYTRLGEMALCPSCQQSGD